VSYSSGLRDEEFREYPEVRDGGRPREAGTFTDLGKPEKSWHCGDVLRFTVALPAGQMRVGQHLKLLHGAVNYVDAFS